VQLFGTKGQTFPSCPGTKGQRDKLKFFPWDRTGRDIERLSRDVPGRDSGTIIYISFTRSTYFQKKTWFFCGWVLFFESKTGKGRSKTGKGPSKTEKDVLKQERIFKNRKMKFKNRKMKFKNRKMKFNNRKSGHFFWKLLSRDRGVCPGIFAPALVPGQRDTGTRKFIFPRTKGQRDVPFRGNATLNDPTGPISDSIL
jgi:hypothetical protein